MRFNLHPDCKCLVLQEDAEDQTAEDLAMVLFETATLRSGYQLADTKAYGDRIERMLRLSMNVAVDEQVTPQQLTGASARHRLHPEDQPPSKPVCLCSRWKKNQRRNQLRRTLKIRRMTLRKRMKLLMRKMMKKW